MRSHCRSIGIYDLSTVVVGGMVVQSRCHPARLILVRRVPLWSTYAIQCGNIVCYGALRCTLLYSDALYCNVLSNTVVERFCQVTAIHYGNMVCYDVLHCAMLYTDALDCTVRDQKR